MSPVTGIRYTTSSQLRFTKRGGLCVLNVSVIGRGTPREGFLVTSDHGRFPDVTTEREIINKDLCLIR